MLMLSQKLNPFFEGHCMISLACLGLEEMNITAIYIDIYIYRGGTRICGVCSHGHGRRDR